MKSVILIMALVFFQMPFAYSANIDLFNKRFFLQRNSDGTLVAVIDRGLLGMAKILKSRDFIRGSLAELIRLSQELRARGYTGDSSRVIQDFLSQDLTLISTEGLQQAAQTLLASFDSEKLRELMNHPEWEKVYTALDLEINKIGDSYATLAHPDSPLYFYKLNLFSGISTGITSLVKSLLPFGAWLDVANYLAKKFVATIQENQKFHKNILLHYVRNFSAKELGISESEIKKILSSLLDDEIPLYAVWDLRNATRDWPNFGEKMHAKSIKKVEKGIHKYGHKFGSLDERWGDYYYLATTKKGHRVVLNFRDPVYYFTRFPSIGLYLDKRWANVLERSVYEVVKFAIRFLPWGFVGTVIDPLLNIRYKNQIEHEGTLMAYLEGDDEEFSLIDDVIRQSINPLIIKSGPLHARTSGQFKPNLLGDFTGLLDY